MNRILHITKRLWYTFKLWITVTLLFTCFVVFPAWVFSLIMVACVGAAWGAYLLWVTVCITHDRWKQSKEIV